MPVREPAGALASAAFGGPAEVERGGGGFEGGAPVPGSVGCAGWGAVVTTGAGGVAAWAAYGTPALPDDRGGPAEPATWGGTVVAGPPAVR